MSLSRIVASVEENEKTLRLLNVPDEEQLGRSLSEFLATQNVSVETERTETGRPSDVAVLSRARDVLTVCDAEELRELLEQVPSGADGLGVADEEFADVLRHLKETTFTSYDFDQLLSATREIEDRAFREGSGVLHAGFQHSSKMASERDVYDSLASRGLEVHTYAVPDGQPPELGDCIVHTPDSEEILGTWFVVFRGVEGQQSALVAEETDDGFFGFWTYDPSIVDELCTYLEDEYASPADGSQATSDL